MTPPSILIIPPLPSEIVMPVTSLILMNPFVVVFIMMPPVGPGMSLMLIMFCKPVCNTMLGLTGLPVSANAGTSPNDHQPPIHTGWFGSPSSNMIQTPELIAGSTNTPCCRPATGTQGLAQVDGVKPPGSSTVT